jgi:glycosyltransferase involved in cell wall biosynthesis
MVEKNKLTVIIPTYNVEIYLDNLLTTLENWADEIIVCDSFSTDSTLSIAQKHNVRILQHEYINSAKQKNWAIPQASNEWVMIVDSDELLEDGLKLEITQFLSSVTDDIHIAYIPRKNKFWGKLYGNGFSYPDYQSRLFRRDKGRYVEREVHASLRVSGKCVHLKHALIHDDFTDISSWWLRNNRYYRYELDECIKQGDKWSLKMQVAKPIYVFLRLYLREGYFRYGFPGFFVAVQWFIYYFMIGAKLYEYELSKTTPIKRKSANPN